MLVELPFILENQLIGNLVGQIMILKNIKSRNLLYIVYGLYIKVVLAKLLSPCINSKEHKTSASIAKWIDDIG